jgi:hypothetical protein
MASLWEETTILRRCMQGSFRESTIAEVLERGEQPPDIQDAIVPAPQETTRSDLLADLERFRQQLIAVVLQAEPNAHLDIIWSHPEFGAMNWREWLLFARVHTLDHARQIQAIVTTLVQEEGAEHETGAAVFDASR